MVSAPGFVVFGFCFVYFCWVDLTHFGCFFSGLVFLCFWLLFVLLYWTLFAEVWVSVVSGFLGSGFDFGFSVALVLSGCLPWFVLAVGLAFCDFVGFGLYFVFLGICYLCFRLCGFTWVYLVGFGLAWLEFVSGGFWVFCWNLGVSWDLVVSLSFVFPGISWFP